MRKVREPAIAGMAGAIGAGLALVALSAVGAWSLRRGLRRAHEQWGDMLRRTVTTEVGPVDLDDDAGELVTGPAGDGGQCEQCAGWFPKLTSSGRCERCVSANMAAAFGRALKGKFAAGDDAA